MAREPYPAYVPTSFPMNTYPIAFRLPPPDGKWYDCAASQYGPVGQTLQVGWIDSVPNSNEFNPCRHSSFDGALTFLGDNSAYGPTWRFGAGDSGSPSNKLTLSGWFNRYGTPLRIQAGKSCTGSVPYMRDRNGVYQYVSLNTSLKYYYYGTRSHSAELVNASVASTAPLGSECLGAESWFCRDVVTGKFPADAEQHALYHYYTIKRPSIRSILIDWNLEYHTKDSYQPNWRVSPFKISTGLGFCLQASKRSMSYVITHVRSTAKAVFWIRIKRIDMNEWDGWQPWSGYSGTDRFETIQELPLATMEPGLVSSVSVDFPIDKFDAYAEKAPVTCESIYRKREAKQARTNAISDVTSLESDWLENVSQSGSALDVVQPLLQGYQAVKNGSATEARKALASAYLAWKYTVRPALSDYADVKANGQQVFNLATGSRFSRERRRGILVNNIDVSSYKAIQRYTCTLYLALKDNAFATVWNALERLGLDPSLDHLWDLIPYSFVVDWFLSVGNVLERISDYISSSVTKDVLARIEGYKVSWFIPAPELSVLLQRSLDSFATPGGLLQYKWYKREIFSTLGSFDPFAGQSNSGLSVSQWAQGAALASNYL